MKILLIFLLIISFLLIGCADQGPVECMVNEDCVAATCCHADSCAAKENAPNCEDILCSMECRPYTMDCEQGRCVCRNHKCAAEISG